GPDDAAASEGPQMPPRAGRRCTGPASTDSAPATSVGADRAAEIFSPSKEQTPKAPPSSQTPEPTQQESSTEAPPAADQLTGRTDLAMRFIDEACGYNWYPCLVGKWPDGRSEVRTFDTDPEKNDKDKWRR